MKQVLSVSIMLVGILVASPWIVNVTSSAGVYNPWYDLDDDGNINIFDIVRMAGVYGTSGVPYGAKSYLAYDSGWINLTGWQSQYINVTHGLGITDWNTENLTVEILGKTDLDTDTLQRQWGLTSELHWVRTYGGVSGESAHAVVQTSDGGYALAGNIVVPGSSTWNDFCLVKTTADGAVEFVGQYGGPSIEFARALVQTSDGGYALAGSTTAGLGGLYSFWLVKTDANGVEEWNQTFGGIFLDEPYAVVQTRDGGYALAGYTESFGAGPADFWLIRTDKMGNMLWNRTYGGAGMDKGRAVIETADYGFALAGYTDSYGLGLDDAWLVKTFRNGTLDWNCTYGGAGSDSASSIVQTVDGGYALAGFTNSFGAGAGDFWLVKTDADGNAMWNRTYGSGATVEDAQSVVQANDEGYALVGDVNNGGNFDCFLVKTDANGTLEWSQTYGGPDWDEVFSIVHTSDGGFAAAGYTYSFDFDNGDIWLIKVGVETGLTWTASTMDKITLYKGATDVTWNYVRIRIWKAKDAP